VEGRLAPPSHQRRRGDCGASFQPALCSVRPGGLSGRSKKGPRHAFQTGTKEASPLRAAVGHGLAPRSAASEPTRTRDHGAARRRPAPRFALRSSGVGAALDAPRGRAPRLAERVLGAPDSQASWWDLRSPATVFGPTRCSSRKGALTSAARSARGSRPERAYRVRLGDAHSSFEAGGSVPRERRDWALVFATDAALGVTTGRKP
jgi:hypothetical protein